MAIRARPGRGEDDYEGDDWDGGYGRGDYGRKRGRRESPSHGRSRRHRCSSLQLHSLQSLQSSTASSATRLRFASTTGPSAAAKLHLLHSKAPDTPMEAWNCRHLIFTGEVSCRSRSESPVRRSSRRQRSRSRSRSRSRPRGADMGDLTYEQYLEAFEKVQANRYDIGYMQAAQRRAQVVCISCNPLM